MARLYSIAFELQKHIEKVKGLSGAVVVYIKHDVSSEFRAAIKKTSGTAVLITIPSARNTNRGKKVLRLSGKYVVTLFTKPIIREKDGRAAEEIIEAIAEQINGWWPEKVPSNGGQWVEVTDIQFPDHPTYSIARMTVEAPGSSQ